MASMLVCDSVNFDFCITIASGLTLSALCTHKSIIISTKLSTKPSNLLGLKLQTTHQGYILQDEMAKQSQDRLALRSQIVAVFLPGRDTTAMAISNVLHNLARRPDVYTKVREGVLQFDQANLTFDLLKSMKYLQWVLNETMRTYPVTAQTIRIALHDTQLPTGGGPDRNSPTPIRKGDTIMTGIWGLHQDTDIWGVDAAEFRPERWRDLKPIWTYIPFSGGPRTCPSQQMVLTPEAYVLARFARIFPRIEKLDPHPWTEDRRIGFQSKYGVQVKLCTT